jgi:hypothetical protein
MRTGYLLLALLAGLLISSCKNDKNPVVESVGDYSLWVDIDKYFGAQTQQLIKVSFVNDEWEYGSLNDGNVSIDGHELEWNESGRYYLLHTSFSLGSDTSYTISVILNSDEVYDSEVFVPKEFQMASIPNELSLSTNSTITWSPVVEEDSVQVMVNARPSEHESWTSKVMNTVPDNGSYEINKNYFASNMKGWEAYVEIVRYKTGKSNQSFKLGSALNTRYTFLKDQISFVE